MLIMTVNYDCVETDEQVNNLFIYFRAEQLCRMPKVRGREKHLYVVMFLEQIEALEDRVASASMQVKGWKLPSPGSSHF